MDAHSLIDLNYPVIVIQIKNESQLEMLTNIDDHDDIMDILEDVMVNMAEKEMDASREVNKVLKRLH